MRTTGIGSLPGTDFRGALGAMREVFPDVLPLPELPARGVGSAMVGRTLGLIEGLGFDQTPSGWRLTDHPGRDQRRASTSWRSDLDDTEELLQGFGGTLKVAIAGPWSLATAIARPRGEALLSDRGAVTELSEALAEGAAMLVQQLGRRVPAASVLLQVDEPGIVAVADGAVPTDSGLGRHSPVELPRLVAALQRITGLGAQTLMHCCAPGSWLGLARSAGFGGVALDARLATGHLDELAAWLDAGGRVVLGVVDTTRPRHQPADELVARALAVLRPLGMDAGSLVAKTWLAPACGMATWPQPLVMPQLEQLARSADLLAEQLTG